MNRRDAIRMFVLCAIADDYENLETITRNVEELGVQCGLTAGPAEITDALASLIEGRLAKAYHLSPRNTFEEIGGMPGPNGLGDWQHSFMATGNGRGILLADPVLDDEGLLRNDWLKRQVQAASSRGGGSMDKEVQNFNAAAAELQRTEFRNPRTPGEWQRMRKDPPKRDD